MVTHDPIAASYCDRVLFIKDGEFFNEIYKDERQANFFSTYFKCAFAFGRALDDLSSIRLP